jgi:hypothetical protein
MSRATEVDPELARLREEFLSHKPVVDGRHVPGLASDAFRVLEELAEADKPGELETAGEALRVLASCMRFQGVHLRFGTPERLAVLRKWVFRAPPSAAPWAVKCVHNATVMDKELTGLLFSSSYVSRLCELMVESDSGALVKAACDSIKGFVLRHPEVSEAFCRSDVAPKTVALLVVKLSATMHPEFGALNARGMCVPVLELAFALGQGSPESASATLDAMSVLGLILLRVIDGVPGVSGAQALRSVGWLLQEQGLAFQVLMHAPETFSEVIVRCRRSEKVLDLVCALCLAVEERERLCWSCLLSLQRFAAASEALRTELSDLLIPPPPPPGFKVGQSPVPGGVRWRAIVHGMKHGGESVHRAALELLATVTCAPSAGEETSSVIKLTGIALAFPLLVARGQIPSG